MLTFTFLPIFLSRRLTRHFQLAQPTSEGCLPAPKFLCMLRCPCVKEMAKYQSHPYFKSYWEKL